MIDLHNTDGEKVKVICKNGSEFTGIVDAVCDAADNFDPDDPESVNEDAICLNVDGEGGPLIFLSAIKEITLLNDE